MPETPPSPSPDDAKWAKIRAEADIAQLKNLIEDATIEDVDEPDGRKEVEIAWEDEDGFHTQEGEAIGVYRERDGRTLVRVHVDWTDGRERTTVAEDELVDLEESEYYTNE